MNFDWYKLFNVDEWIAAGLVADTITANLEGKGRVSFEVTQGNTTAIKLASAEVFLPVGFLENNPYIQGDYAVYLDAANDVYFGYPVEA